MIIHIILSKMNNKVLPTFLQAKYRDSLGEFSNTSYGIFGAVMVKYTDRVVVHVAVFWKLSTRKFLFQQNMVLK